MLASIVIIIFNTILCGKVMKQLEFVLFNRGILLSLDGAFILLAYYWYDAY